MEASINGEASGQLDKMKLKGMVWKVIDEVFSARNSEEIIGTMLEGAISAIEDKNLCCRKGERNVRKEEDEVRGGVFLEEKLLESMMHSKGREHCVPIGAFESLGSDC